MLATLAVALGVFAAAPDRIDLVLQVDEMGLTPRVSADGRWGIHRTPAGLGLWDYGSGLRLGVVKAKDDSIVLSEDWCTLTPDGANIACALRGRVVAIDVESGVARDLDPPRASKVVADQTSASFDLWFSKDGSRLFVGRTMTAFRNGDWPDEPDEVTVGAWNFSNGRHIATIVDPKAKRSSAAAYAVGPSADELYYVDRDQIRRYDMTTGVIAETIPFPVHLRAGYTEFAISDDGSRAASTHLFWNKERRRHERDTLAFWDWTKRRVENTVALGDDVMGLGPIRAVTLSSDGSLVAARTLAGSEPVVRVFPFGEDQPIREIPNERQPLAFLRQTSHLIAGTSVVDVQSGLPIVAPAPKRSSSKHVELRGGKLFVLDDKRGVTAWDAQTLSPLWRVPPDKLDVRSQRDPVTLRSWDRFVVSPTGRHIVIELRRGFGSRGVELVVLETRRGEELARRWAPGADSWDGLGFVDDDTVWFDGNDSWDRWSFATGEVTKTPQRRGKRPEELHFGAASPDGKWFVAQADNPRRYELRNADTGRARVLKIDDQGYTAHFLWTPYGLVSEADGLLEFRDFEGRVGRSHRLPRETVIELAVSPDGQTVVIGYDDTLLRLDAATGKTIDKHKPGVWGITALALDAAPNWIAVIAEAGVPILINLEKDALVRLHSVGDEWIASDDRGYFTASRAGGRLLAAARGTAGFPIDQLALRYNHPAELMRGLGVGAEAVIDYYDRQYERRLRRAKIERTDLDDLFADPPTASFDALEVEGPVATIAMSLAAARGLHRYNIDVDGVPVYGSEGKAVSGTKQRVTAEVELGEGAHRIELRVIDKTGIEGLRPVRAVRVTAESSRDLYVLGFGVSEYADPDLRLKYARKDVLDLAAALQSAKSAFTNVHTRVYVDAAVTPDAIRQARDFTQQAGVDDTVIVMVAGHGVHSLGDDPRYYYLTHGADLDRLEATAAPFEDIEALLDGIDARRKLFLMDTCESGERDEQTTPPPASADARFVPRTARAVRRIEGPVKPRPYVLERNRFLFNVLFRRSGAVVLSSSSGLEYSYESDELANGTFTQAVLEALTTSPPDEDGDGSLDTVELRDFVADYVSSYTEGAQNPTVDRDNRAASIRLPVLTGASAIAARTSAELPDYAFDTPPEPVEVAPPAVAPKQTGCRASVDRPRNEVGLWALMLLAARRRRSGTGP